MFYSTDEDARQAMLIDGGKIKEVKIKLLLSSRSEMQKVIETARAQSIAIQSFMHLPAAPIPTTTLQAAQIPPTPVQTAPAMPVMTPMSLIPLKPTTPEAKPPLLPAVADIPTPEAITDPTKQAAEIEKKDQGKDADKDTSHKDKDAKRSRRRSRSRSKNKSRSKSKDRSKSRDRSRSRDRYRSRRDRKRKDRSRDRSRDRRDRRRHRDRSRSRDRSRKSSRDRKRDNDRGDRNSLENGKSADKDAAQPQNVAPNAVGKPGFKSSGWVPAGTADKPLNPVLPAEYPGGKPNIPTPLRKNTTDSPLLPMHLNPNQIQPSLATPSVPLQMPPAFPMDALKNPDGSFGPFSFPNPTLQNVPFTQKQPGKPGEQLQPPSGWQPMISAPPGINVNAPIGGNIPPFLNPGMGMYMNPAISKPPERFPAPYIQDPRLQPAFPLQGNNFRPEQSEHDEGNFQGRDFDPTKKGFFSNNSCLEIRNMPLNTTIMDIKQFFQGMHIPRDGIKIITDKKGNKVGMAYVRFAKPMYKDLALKKTGLLLKNSVVELLTIEDRIFDQTPDFTEHKSNFSEESQPRGFNRNYNEFSEPHIPAEPFTDLVIHEVPSIANDNDIYNLFGRGYNISDAFLLIGMGMKTATGYIRFQNPAEAKRALMNSSRLSVRYQSVKVAACYENEFDDARDRKNMEEIDEEMDSSDNYDASGPYHTRDTSMSHLQESRYKNDSRPPSKGLLPTPGPKPFGSRDPRGNNVNSHSDRRNEDVPRSTRGGYNRRPYDREDHRDRHPPPRERSRFGPREGNDPRRRPPHNDFGNYQEEPEHSSFEPRRPAVSTPVVKDKPKIEQASSAPKTDSDDRRNKDSDDRVKTDSDDRAGKTSDLKKEAHVAPKADLPTETKPQISNNVSEVNLPIAAETSAVEPKPTSPVKARDENHSTPNLNNARQMPGGREHHSKRTSGFIDTDCLILKGLPYTATDRDILDFFSDEGLAPTQIHIMLDKQEKPAGDAFCEFNTSEEVERALSKDQTLMGRSVVSVEAVSREQMMQALGTPVVPHHEPSYPDFAEYPPRHQQFYPPRGSHSRYPQPFPPRGRGRGAFRGRFHPPASHRDGDSQNVNSFGKPGCVIAMENVPFRAEVQDILEFFRGYHLTKDNVIRRFDESGKATGDARVCLNSPSETQRALRTLNHGPIFNRQIFLSLVP